MYGVFALDINKKLSGISNIRPLQSGGEDSVYIIMETFNGMEDFIGL